MKNEEGYEIYTKTISMKDLKDLKKQAKKIGAIDSNGNVDPIKIFKEDIK